VGHGNVKIEMLYLSGFRALPQKGHLERARRVCSYLFHMKHAVICFRVSEPYYSALTTEEYNWRHSIYGNIKEQLPVNAPPPMVNFVMLTHFVDANLLHCMLTGDP
jgi:hypothetical protein